ncbi:MAG: thioredoxin [Spirochaetaceae bacterium]|nr:thioredoxin [Spirochaetaceae bacterium]
MITSETFDVEVLQSPLPVLLDFWAPWCGPCRMMGKVLDQLEPAYQGRLVIGRINVDDERRLMERHGITAIPTLIVYKNGQIIAQRAGAQSKTQIDRLVHDALESLT